MHRDAWIAKKGECLLYTAGQVDKRGGCVCSVGGPSDNELSRKVHAAFVACAARNQCRILGLV